MSTTPLRIHVGYQQWTMGQVSPYAASTLIPKQVLVNSSVTGIWCLLTFSVNASLQGSQIQQYRRVCPKPYLMQHKKESWIEVWLGQVSQTQTFFVPALNNNATWLSLHDLKPYVHGVSHFEIRTPLQLEQLAWYPGVSNSQVRCNWLQNILSHPAFIRGQHLIEQCILHAFLHFTTRHVTVAPPRQSSMCVTMGYSWFPVARKTKEFEKQRTRQEVWNRTHIRGAVCSCHAWIERTGWVGSSWTTSERRSIHQTW